MADLLADVRRPSFRYSTVSDAGVRLWDIPRVSARDGRIELSQQAEIRASGELMRAVADGAESHRIKIEYILDAGRSTEQSWPVGVFLSASPETTYGATVASSGVDIYDGTLALRDAIERPLILSTGTLVTVEIERQLTLAGVPSNMIAITASSKTLRSSMAFKAGTKRLTIINQLLDAIDYFSIYCDGDGLYRCEPYLSPLQRGVAWKFRDGENAIFEHPFEVVDDTYSVPNKVIGISRTDGQEPPLVAVQAIQDTSSPFHFNNVGRWRTEVMADVEVTTQADLQKKVDRRILEAGTVARVLTIRHAWVPIGINSVVEFSSDGIEGRFVVFSQSIPLDPRQLVTTKAREVTKWMD